MTFGRHMEAVGLGRGEAHLALEPGQVDEAHVVVGVTFGHGLHDVVELRAATLEAGHPVLRRPHRGADAHCEHKRFRFVHRQLDQVVEFPAESFRPHLVTEAVVHPKELALRVTQHRPHTVNEEPAIRDVRPSLRPAPRVDMAVQPPRNHTRKHFGRADVQDQHIGWA